MILLLQQLQYKRYRSKEGEIESFTFVSHERSIIAPDVLIRQLNHVQTRLNMDKLKYIEDTHYV